MFNTNEKAKVILKNLRNSEELYNQFFLIKIKLSFWIKQVNIQEKYKCKV